MGGLRVEIRALGRTDSPLPEAHGFETLQVQLLRPLLLALRPPSTAHEETSVTTVALVQHRVAYFPFYYDTDALFVKDQTDFLYCV